MYLAVNLRTAFVADAHTAQRLTVFPPHRGATRSACLQDGRGHGRAGAKANCLAVN